MNPALTLLVLRCCDLEASRRFYEALGLRFSHEQHGNGPAHWSCLIGATVLELYPADQRAPSLARIGLRVADVSGAVEAVASIGERVRERSDHGTRAVVEDPDGTTVELSRESAVPAPTWSVWRQDDNGNRARVSGGHARADADRIASEFEARGHKQMYWVSPDDA